MGKGEPDNVMKKCIRFMTFMIPDIAQYNIDETRQTIYCMRHLYICPDADKRIGVSSSSYWFCHRAVFHIT